MLFERIYDQDLAQASFIIGCQANGEAVVVDPRRDIEVYLRLAASNGMTIVGVTETHIHADYLSGSRELAAATGATLYVSGEGGDDWQYRFEAERLHDGDAITVGNIKLRALHTPGHTPEHLSFLVIDGALTDDPGYLLSGDFVFAGDLGRPDLLDEAAGGQDTRFIGAKQMFASLRDKFLTLPDHIQVHPGHGAGSACGKALGAVPSSTVGYERLYSWWGPYLAADDEEGFITELLDGQPDAPFYFGRMKTQNRAGAAVMGERPTLVERDGAQVASELRSGSINFIDTRSSSEVHEGTPLGALNVPAPGKIATYASWAINPATDARPIVVLAPDLGSAQEISDHLVRVGIDTTSGFVTDLSGFELTIPKVVTVDDLDDAPRALLLDVRAKSEHAAGAIPGSEQLHGGRVLWNLETLPKNGPIIAYCQSGLRSSVVSSMMRAQGFDVVELEGSYLAWEAQAQAQARETVSS
ncbi:MAG: MBL fold metallo-hydrolase [Cryobacterium sp.]